MEMITMISLSEERKEKLGRVWWWIKVYAAEAVVIAIILYAIAVNSGCTNTVAECSAKAERPAGSGKPLDISMDISRIVREMKNSGCYPTGVGVSYTNPTSYSISVSAKYYDALDTNNTFNGELVR